MLQDSDTTIEKHYARRGPDGLAQIGPSLFDLRGIRFLGDNEGADGAGAGEGTGAGDGAGDGAGEGDGAGADASGQGSGDGNGDGDEGDGFDGEFDAKRARSLITKLRSDLKAANAAKAAPKPEAQDPKLTGENLRLRIALRAGLDEDLADRLRGSNEEELLADAEKLVERLSPAAKKPLEQRIPQTNLRGGSDPNKEPELTSVDVVKAALGR